MINLTAMIEINNIYNNTLKVRGYKSAIDYYNKIKEEIKSQYNITEDLFRSLWNASVRINNN